MASPQRDLADRRRTADRRAEARSGHGSSRSWRSRTPPRSGCSTASRCCRATSSSKPYQGGPAGGGLGSRDRRRPSSPGWVPFASRNTCPASASSSSATRSTGRRTARATSCRISTGSCSSSCRAKTRRRCGSSRARPTSPTRLSATNFEVLLKDQAAPQLRAHRSRSRARLHVSVFQPERSRGERAGRAGAPAARGSASWRSGRPCRRRSIARASSASTYRGRATPLWGHVPPGNKLWVNQSLPKPAPFDRARASSCCGRPASRGRPTARWSTSRASRSSSPSSPTPGTRNGSQIATIIQDDLKQLGMRVSVVTLELRALLDRLLTTHDYDACVLGLGGGDGDPNSEMNVWLSSGTTHLWNPGQTPAGDAVGSRNRRVDAANSSRRAMPQLRKRLYDRVQELVAAEPADHQPREPQCARRRDEGARQLPADGPRPSRALERRGVVLAREAIRCAAMNGQHRRARRFGEPDVTWSDARLIRACLTATSTPGRADRQVQEPDLLDSVEIRRDAAGRGRHFSIGLSRVVLRAAASSQAPTRSAAGSITRDGASVLPLEAKGPAARRRRADAPRRRAARRSTPSPDLIEQVEREQMLREAVAALPRALPGDDQAAVLSAEPQFRTARWPRGSVWQRAPSGSFAAGASSGSQRALQKRGF